MANVYFLLILPLAFFNVASAAKIVESKESFYVPGFNLKEIERQYRAQGQRVERPCPVYDLLCIRRHLARHSACKIAEGPVPERVYRTAVNTYFPNSNLSVTQHEQTLTGLTGTVSEFTVNRKSQLTVLTVDFANVTLNSRKVYFRFHRRGQEPAVTTTTQDDEFFPSITVTTVFKGVDHLRLADSESVVSVNAPAVITVGPDGGEHPDPTIAPRYAAFLANQYVLLQEGFLTVAPFFAATYIQNVLCDFGLKLN